MRVAARRFVRPSKVPARTGREHQMVGCVERRTDRLGGMCIELRVATATDSRRLQQIEIDAGEQFRTVGMSAVADHDPLSLEELLEYAEAGRSFVAHDGDRIVGYIVLDRVEDAAHIEQVSVVPDAQGRGIGRALVDQARAWAESQQLRALTLTTFRDVAWNGPLYAHLGFRVMAEDELSAELRALRDHEAELGLDPAQRVCMRLDL